MSTEAKVPPEQLVAAAAAEAAADPPAVAEAASAQPNVAVSSEGATSNGGGENPKQAAYDKKWHETLDQLRPLIKSDGTIDYSSLDEDAKKKMQNFVKHQRKCYMKRENNETSPMTAERIALLSAMNFDFNPKETAKAKAQAKKQAKEAKSTDSAKKKKAKPKSGATPKKVGENVERADSAKKPAAVKSPGSAQTEGSDKKSPNSVSDTPMKSDDPDGKTPGKKSPKSASKASSPSGRKKSGKPTYLEMAHEAIVSLKDYRTGSSLIAISKWILAHHEHAKAAPPNMFKSRLSTAMKQGVKDGRFVKVKNSFKINAEWTKKEKAKTRAAEAKKRQAEKKRKTESDKARKEKDQEKAKKRAAEERKRKEKNMTPEERAEEARKQKKKEEEEAKSKWISEQLRKRRFPIEDTRLHREDKEWKQPPQKNVERRPALPHTMTCLVPPHLRSNTPKTYQGPVANASKSGAGPALGGQNERGLITDAIHVYHFFCGDVGLEDEDHPIPQFSLKTLLYALDEVLNGNAKAAKSLPPLLTHLFVTVLRMLTEPRKVDGNAVLSPADLRLDEDLAKLGEGLNAVSWSQIVLFYMDMMERYFTSDVSIEAEEVLPGDLDMSYYWNKDEDAMDVDDAKAEPQNGYKAYLGDASGVLAKGFFKLQAQAEPWTLKADELMALLRALTDDVLAKRPDLAEDIASRSAKLHELTKAKRNAVMKFNKVRLAYEGPKKPTRPKKVEGKEGEEGDKKEEADDAESKEDDEKPFVPTATKKQFDAAEKAKFKADDAFDTAVNKLISRSQPVGFDRNFNAVYIFRTDPSMLHVEELKHTSLPPEIKNLGVEHTPFSTWHFIDTKPLFEQFLASLDGRGKRERETINECNDLTILKRRLLDDKKDDGRASAREREKEDLERRLENARTACAAEDGRRSGRLAGMAQEELQTLEEEAKEMAKSHAEEERQEKIDRDKASDYSMLTGLQTVTDLFAGQRATRSSRKSEEDDSNDATLLAHTAPHQLWMDNRTGGNGTVQVLAEALLAVEAKCNELSPWSREDISRGDWRKQLNDVSCAWAIDCVMQLGPLAKPEGDSNKDGASLTSPSPAKRQKTASTPGASVGSIVSTLKACLKELELRIFEFSFKKKAIEEADTAAENEGDSSDEEENEELNKRRNCWKIKINALKRVPTARQALVRDIIVAAITVARKSHLSQVAAELKAALQLLRPHAAGEAKLAAIDVLEKHGGYDGSDDEDDDVDLDELAAANAGENNDAEEEAEAEIASMLCDEVRMIGGSVGGDDFADPSDWGDALKECKSVSRLAAMTQIFLYKAVDTLDQLAEERSNLDSILNINAKRTSRSKSIKKHDTSTNIWCSAKLTDKLVKARVSGFPWWPAHVCEAIDPLVADALEGSQYSLISSVGNSGMYLVPNKDMIDFVQETDEDLSQFDQSVVEDLQESMAIAKKLWRSRNRGVASPWRKKSRPRFIEEKKTEETD